MHKLYYLYKITNLINKKVYIGQSTDPRRRWSDHKSEAFTRPRFPISRAIAKYGVLDFEFEVIASCKTFDDVNEMEKLLIIQYNSRDRNKGYNLAIGGQPTGTGNKTLLTPKQEQQIISEYQLGKTRCQLAAENHVMIIRITKILKEANLFIRPGGTTGKKLPTASIERKQKISFSHLGKRKLTPEQIQLIKQDTRTESIIATDYNVSMSTIKRYRGKASYNKSRI